MAEETKIYMEEEELSDGSIAYNLILDDGYGNRLVLECETEKKAESLALAIEDAAVNTKVMF